MKKEAILLSLVVFFAVSCAKNELETPNVNATLCKQDVLKSSELPDKVEVEFTAEGVHITYYDFEVTCDFTDVNVTHTLENGVLNITQQGTPNQAKCICYTDVSYTIDGISQNEVNIIFINGVQVYCNNENDISACGVNDPMRNIEWLKKLCESPFETQSIATVTIDLYKVIDKDEYFFLIKTNYRYMSPAVWFDWRNCNGECIFRITAEAAPWVREEYEIFLSDKEFVTRLFDYLLPVCGVNNPLQNIKWLKEYCESVKEKQDISSVQIHLFESKKDGHVFRILTGFPWENAPNQGAEYFSEVWKNCAGEEWEFPKDLVYITEIFKFVKQ